MNGHYTHPQRYYTVGTRTAVLPSKTAQEMSILRKQHIYDIDFSMLGAIDALFDTDDRAMIAMLYGIIMGKRIERARRRENTTASERTKS